MNSTGVQSGLSGRGKFACARSERVIELLRLAKGVLKTFVAARGAPPPAFREDAPLPSLPAGFLWGAATAAHQVEGGNHNDWTLWEEDAYPDGRPHIADRTVSGAACDSWNRFDRDLALLTELGANAYRFGVEWSRIEPTPGRFDDAAIDRYRGWLRQLREAGITPMVTLHHFTLPVWLSDHRLPGPQGFERDGALDAFERYVRYVGARLGDQVDVWCTLNEPNVFTAHGFLKGIWPPGVVDQKRSTRVLAAMMEAHARATLALREVDTVDADGDGHATRIGIAHHVRVFQPATGSFFDAAIAALLDDYFNEALVRMNRTGRILLTIPGTIGIDREVPGLKGSFDWLGLNYYSRDHVRADFKDPALSRLYTPDERPKSDLGWDLYPEGLYLLLRRFAAEKLPLYITENGMADNAGGRRPGFLRAHLAALAAALRDGADVRGYFHWSLLDNFEWAEGYEPRFGLYRVDFQSAEKTRTATPAVAVFQEVARSLRR